MENNGTKQDLENRKPTEPVLYELVAADGRTHGPFESAHEAAEYARHEFPGQQQDEERSGKGWDVQVAGSGDGGTVL